MEPETDPVKSHQKLLQAIQEETLEFQRTYLWIEKAMPPSFFEDITREQLLLITHSLMGFDLQDYFSTIRLKDMAISLCLESPDADVKILNQYRAWGIKNYQGFVSRQNLPFPGITAKLRVALIYFLDISDEKERQLEVEEEIFHDLKLHVRGRNPEITDQDFEELIQGFNPRFLKGISLERTILATQMYFKARTSDLCQYEVRYNEDWQENGLSSLQIVMAWKNTPKYNFLYVLARCIHRHHLVIRRVNATHISPYSKENILIMILGLHGEKDQAAWDVAKLPDFLRELVRVKYFAAFDLIDEELVETNLLTGNEANLLRTFIPLLHQFLLPLDPNFYTPERIEEALCRHPELTEKVMHLFPLKFCLEEQDLVTYAVEKEKICQLIHKLDTGHLKNDGLRKNVFLQMVTLFDYILKTNFYLKNATTIAFRIDPEYMEALPYNYKERFPEKPFGIFFIKGMHFFGFHVRFKDLSRGGLRTVCVQNLDQFYYERDLIFSEAYNLAYTQHKKNKEIPEGGSKGVIFLKPFDRLESEAKILFKELETAGETSAKAEQMVQAFREEQREEYVQTAQRSYIEGLIELVNCDEEGHLKESSIVDMWKRPEYLYVGPDEKMSNEVIECIANYSKEKKYTPGSAFISSKPTSGINHKQYGATSLGVVTYMEKTLRFLGIDPQKEIFRVKLSGGPDGDVAGNMLLNLYRRYPKTAKVVALTDVSGTIYDPEGLDLEILQSFFPKALSIRNYPHAALHEGGFLLDLETKRKVSAYSVEALCVRKQKGEVVEGWLTSSDSNHLFRHHMHQVPADVFVTAGGRPRTLNESNWTDLLDKNDQPLAQVIVEGANLYLTQEARDALEGLGVLLIKDSSANKTGVMCSSFEILAGLALGDTLFVQEKEVIVEQILQRLEESAVREADLLLRTYQESLRPLSEISIEISNRMNQYKYELLDYLEFLPFPTDEEHPLVQIYFKYALPILREKYRERLLKNVPDVHKKAVVATYLASMTVYTKGLGWSPTLVDIFPLLLEEFV